MKKILYALVIASMVSMMSCADESKTGTPESENKVEKSTDESITTEDGCIYIFHEESTKLQWKAYKTTDRVAVGGSFDKIDYKGEFKGNSIISVLETISFSIPTEGINTGDSERDATLTSSFFKVLVPEGNIYGTVQKVEGDESQGVATVMVKLNGAKLPVQMKYSINDNSIKLNGSLNLETFHGQTAMESLDTKCHDLHAGEDGVSKLWPDIDLGITAKFEKICD